LPLIQELKQAALRQSRHLCRGKCRAFASCFNSKENPRRGFSSFPDVKRLKNSPILRFANAKKFRCLRTATKGFSPLETRSLFEKSDAKTFNEDFNKKTGGFYAACF